MNVEREQVGWGFWIQWVLATSAVPSVGLVGLTILLTVIRSLALDGIILIVGEIVGLPLVLASSLIAQWLVLRKHITRAILWVIANSVGVAVRFAAVLVPGMNANDVVILVLSLAVYGAITGGVVLWLLQQPHSEGQL